MRNRRSTAEEDRPGRAGGRGHARLSIRERGGERSSRSGDDLRADLPGRPAEPGRACRSSGAPRAGRPLRTTGATAASGPLVAGRSHVTGRSLGACWAPDAGRPTHAGWPPAARARSGGAPCPCGSPHSGGPLRSGGPGQACRPASPGRSARALSARRTGGALRAGRVPAQLALAGAALPALADDTHGTRLVVDAGVDLSARRTRGHRARRPDRSADRSDGHRSRDGPTSSPSKTCRSSPHHTQSPAFQYPHAL